MQNQQKSIPALLLALLKREVLEHKNLWRVPAVLLVIALLLKLSLSFGKLALNIDVPEQLNLDEEINQFLTSAIGKTLHLMNYFVMIVMFVVAIFYALSCLYEERQDDSVLFWRSLPISDWLTVTSKLLIPLLIVPVIILVSQAIIAVLFLGADTGEYFGYAFVETSSILGKKILWTLLPVVAWCVFCSGIAKKNPFLLAFVTPIILVLIDKLFLQGVISQTFLINRLTGVGGYSTQVLLTGIIFSIACIAGAIVKRSQRI